MLQNMPKIKTHKMLTHDFKCLTSNAKDTHKKLQPSSRKKKFYSKKE